MIIIANDSRKRRGGKKRIFFSSVIITRAMGNNIFSDAFIAGTTNEYSTINENDFR